MPDDDVRLLGEILDGWAGATPDGEALAYQDRKWTWRELHDQVARLSGALSTAGIGRGDRVAFVDKNHSACLQVTFAAAAPRPQPGMGCGSPG